MKTISSKFTVDFATLFPNNFEKQKVQLVANVFNEKVIACLKLNSISDTARFVELARDDTHMTSMKTV